MPPEIASFALPPGFPVPKPESGAASWTLAKAELGRHLFYDKRLSANGTQACSSCHEQERAFSDGRALPIGSTGDLLPRNAPGLANVVYFASFTWANPVLDSLEKQALVPLFADSPKELGWNDSEAPRILQTLGNDARYRELVRAAFPGTSGTSGTSGMSGGAATFTKDTVVSSLAAFQRSMISGRSRYDRFAYDKDASALTAEEQVGLSLFFSERAECYHCHTGITFGGSFVGQGTTPSTQFENNGLYNLDARGSYPSANNGMNEFTSQDNDRGRFRVPTLRNVGVTAPYMHDGSIATLEDVVAHYENGGRLTPEGPNAGDGRQNPNKNSLVRAFDLSAAERAALVAFLRALTDEAFLRDPRHSDPWK